MLGAVLALALLGGVWELERGGRVPPRLVFEPGARAELALVPSGDVGERTRAAVRLLEAGRIEGILFSGAGHGGDSGAVLAAYARDLGAPPDRVWVEPHATSTYQNVRLGLAWIRARRPDLRRLVVVTSATHAARAGLVAEKEAAGMRVFVFGAQDAPSFAARAREAAARMLYRWRGWM